MLRKKKVLAIAGVACIIVASLLSVVYVAASPAWTIDDMVDYMENIGRHKIYQTNWILHNEIDPKLDDIQQGVHLTWDEITEEVIPMLNHMARVTAASETYTNEGWMPGWHNVEVVDLGVGKAGRFTLSYAGKTADLQGIDAEAWIWLQITSDGAYWRTVETIHLTKPAVPKLVGIPYRTYEFAARGFRIRVLLHTQAGKTLTLNYAYFYEVLP